MVHELWRVDLTKNPFELQRMLTSTTELALVDCRPFDVQCVALDSDVREVSQLRRWQVTPAQWEEITPTQSIQGFPGSILASSPQGTWLELLAKANDFPYEQHWSNTLATSSTQACPKMGAGVLGNG